LELRPHPYLFWWKDILKLHGDFRLLARCNPQLKELCHAMTRYLVGRFPLVQVSPSFVLHQKTKMLHPLVQRSSRQEVRNPFAQVFLEPPALGASENGSFHWRLTENRLWKMISTVGSAKTIACGNQF